MRMFTLTNAIEIYQISNDLAMANMLLLYLTSKLTVPGGP